MANRFITFFEKVGAALKKLFSNPTLEQQIASTIGYIAPVVETIVSLTLGQAIAAKVAAIMNEVQTDLATAYALVQGATLAPGSSVNSQLQAVLGSVKTNLTGLLTDADVKNSAKFTEIEAEANLIIGELEQVLKNLPGSSSSSSAPAAPAGSTTTAAPAAS